MNTIETLGRKTDNEITDLIAGWGGCIQDGFTINDWEEAVAMAKADPQSSRPLVDIGHQLLLIKRRYINAGS